MNTFWSVLAKLGVKVALYAASHPDEVLQLVAAAKK